MPRVTESALAALRMRYHAAHAAHQSCLRAITEASLSGSEIAPALLEHEAKALRELAKLRAELLAAMTHDGVDEAADQPP
jgi:hypothetical protein